MVAARNAVRESGVRYKRHQPERTLLYQIIETYYPEFLGYMESQGKTLPNHIKKEFEAYLKCGGLEVSLCLLMKYSISCLYASYCHGWHVVG